MKLKEERSAYLEYQKVMRELEHLTKLVVAYQFVCAEVRGVPSRDFLKIFLRVGCVSGGGGGAGEGAVFPGIKKLPFGSCYIEYPAFKFEIAGFQV